VLGTGVQAEPREEGSELFANNVAPCGTRHDGPVQVVECDHGRHGAVVVDVACVQGEVLRNDENGVLCAWRGRSAVHRSRAPCSRVPPELGDPVNGRRLGPKAEKVQLRTRLDASPFSCDRSCWKTKVLVHLLQGHAAALLGQGGTWHSTRGVGWGQAQNKRCNAGAHMYARVPDWPDRGGRVLSAL